MPFARGGTEKINRRGDGGVRFWEKLITSQMEIALFAESFAIFCSEQFIQSPTLEGMGGWASQVGRLGSM